MAPSLGVESAQPWPIASSGAAQESNLPTLGRPRPAGFEDGAHLVLEQRLRVVSDPLCDHPASTAHDLPAASNGNGERSRPASTGGISGRLPQSGLPVPSSGKAGSSIPPARDLHGRTAQELRERTLVVKLVRGLARDCDSLARLVRQVAGDEDAGAVDDLADDLLPLCDQPDSQAVEAEVSSRTRTARLAAAAAATPRRAARCPGCPSAPCCRRRHRTRPHRARAGLRRR
jgi:hypothetical protein